MPLQPHRTFIAETTRLNALYWTSRYAVRALVELQKAKSTALPQPAQRERNNMGAGSPRPDRLLASLRVAAILHICSAFEHALASYFAICLLYRPKRCSSTKRFRQAPDVLADPGTFADLRKKVTATADGQMKAEYTKRLEEFHARFDLDLSWLGEELPQPNEKKRWGEELDRFQKIRHTVAHDQALDGADDPALSSSEIIDRAARLCDGNLRCSPTCARS
jgi:hypothetical protein